MIEKITYKEFIDNIINTRGQWNIPKNTYFESHHILPKCMGGLGNKKSKHENIIWLYADEHFIAHKLLALENPDNYKIVAAWKMMCSCTAAKNNKRFYEVTSEDYKICRELWGKVWSEKMRQICEEHKLNNIGIFSNESKRKSAKSRIGTKRGPHSKEWNEAIGSANKGKTYYNNGVINICAFECPDGFIPGRIINYDDSNRLKVIQEKQCKMVQCLDTGVVYNSIKEASLATGATHIGQVCKGKLNQSGGFRWQYYNQ